MKFCTETDHKRVYKLRTKYYLQIHNNKRETVRIFQLSYKFNLIGICANMATRMWITLKYKSYLFVNVMFDLSLRMWPVKEIKHLKIFPESLLLISVVYFTYMKTPA